MPTYLFYIVMYLLPQSVVTFPTESRWVVMLLVCFTTFIIPALGTYFMYRHGHISNLQLADRPERNLPFFFTALCYAVTTYLFYQEAYFDRIFFYIMGLITVSVFLTFLFSFWYKISAHAVGIGGVLGILLWLNGHLPETYLLYLITAVTLLAGVVMSARLALNAHTPTEVYSGFVLGFSVSFGMLVVTG